ncbi:MAG: NAD(P)/FAD-dependent oxidoreductase [Verrucomicrobiota bacterium]
MKKDLYDVAVIGGGPAGVTAAVESAKRGLSVALIEKDSIGGAYLHDGCISVKSLAVSEKRYRQFLRGMDYGIYPETVQINVSEWMNRQRNVSSKIHLITMGKIEKYPEIKLLQGAARFISDNALEIVESHRTYSIGAKSIIIATGSHPSILHRTELDGDKIGTSQHYVHRPKLPKSLTILGGGYIGCEFAGIYATLGTKVTLIELKDHLLPQMEKEAGEFLAKKYLTRGIEIVTGDGAVSSSIQQNGLCRVELQSGRIIESENVLLAVGRTPNVEGLELDRAGVQYDRAILVDESLQTTAPGIYAIGDVNGLNPLAHSAMVQARAVVQRLIHEPEPVDFRQIPFCVYTDPEITCVGHTEASAKKAGLKIRKVVVPFHEISRAIAQGESEGFLSLIMDLNTNRILGGLLIGNEATELVSFLCLALQMNATAQHLANTVIPHPSYAEIFQVASRRLLEMGHV